MRSLRIAVAGVALLAFGACATNGPEEPVVGPQVEQSRVTVENWTGEDLRIYALFAGELIRMGKAPALGSARLSMPARAGGEVRLVAMPPGSVNPMEQHVSEKIFLYPGETVAWQLRGTGGSSLMKRGGDAEVAGALRPR